MRASSSAYSGGLETSIAIPVAGGDATAPKSSPSRSTSARARSARGDARSRARGRRAARPRRSTCATPSRATTCCRRSRPARLGSLSPIAAALGRPLIAQKLVEIAGIEQAATVAHRRSPRRDASRARPTDPRARSRRMHGAGAGRRVGDDAGSSSSTTRGAAQRRRCRSRIQRTLGDRATRRRARGRAHGRASRRRWTSRSSAARRSAINGVAMPLLDLIAQPRHHRRRARRRPAWRRLRTAATTRSSRPRSPSRAQFSLHRAIAERLRCTLLAAPAAGSRRRGSARHARAMRVQQPRHRRRARSKLFDGDCAVAAVDVAVAETIALARRRRR